MDSILANPNYLPRKKADIDPAEFPSKIQYVSDTLSYALYMHVLNPGDYKPMVGKWNMLTGKERFHGIHRSSGNRKETGKFCCIRRKTICMWKPIWYHDLITICSLDGKLKYTLYGEKWDNRKSNKNGYYSDIAFCKDKLIMEYLGDARFKNDESTSINPTKLIVFDLEGNHLKTLETGYSISNFSYDKENNRLIIVFDDEIQFGYLNLDTVL